MKRLRYICAQPATMYFTWQVEVMLHNFTKHGIPQSDIDVVCGKIDGDVSVDWLKLSEKYKDVGFYFYEDTRPRNSSYSASIVPHLLAKHFRENPHLQDEVIFQHDSDMVFTRPVNWNKYLTDDIWYLSNTEGYIGAKYIKSKGHGIYETMCDIVGIDRTIPELRMGTSGGAQYIMKNLDHLYWEKVERDAIQLHGFFEKHLQKHPKTDSYLPIQMWTAGMWSQLWNGWLLGHRTRIVQDMEFLWPYMNITEWDNYTIYHNSGVLVTDSDRMFKKNWYMYNLPYTIKLEDYDDDICSYRYVQEIVDTARDSCLI